jgi:hypothetical protein
MQWRCMGIEGMDLCVLSWLRTNWNWVVIFTPPVPIGGWMGVRTCLTIWRGEKLASTGIWSPTHRTSSVSSRYADWDTVSRVITRQIQGVSRLKGTTAEDDFLGLCDKKSSYKHVSDFGRLRRYDRFFIRVHALVWIASVIRAFSLSRHLSGNYGLRGKAGWVGFTTERQPVLRPAVAFSKISFKHR